MKKISTTSSFIATSALALVVCAQAALAASDPHWVDVSIVNRNTGERLTPYRHGGKLYVAGTPGDRYAVELKSKRGERMLSVLSVDGVNVITGETAATLQSGYVIEGWQRHAVNGWRKGMDGVAQFAFTALPDSYAARTGRPHNVGVIGVAVYREKVVPPPAQLLALSPFSPSAEPSRPYPAPQYRAAPTRDDFDGAGNAAASAMEERRADSAKSAASSQAAQASQASKETARLGTGHGAREYSPMRYTEFDRNSDTPDEIVTIYYDSRANLIARGIIRSPRYAEPFPFPASPGFVPDPRT